ncbi:MAG: ATP-binding cassette domain-containing protein, partial [Polaromonas sp.]|nr:ATP-binding cassette domain-containing protein [Polaromonas sp.]
MTVTDTSRTLIDMGEVRKSYNLGLPSEAEVLHGVSLQVQRGEFIALIGPSGSGKSTLLKCLGAIIEPTSGRMTLGHDVIYDNGWTTPDLRALRRDRIGF